LTVNSIRGLKPLSHCCPGMATSFSKTPEGREQEASDKLQAASSHKKGIFNEDLLCKIKVKVRYLIKNVWLKA
jgi:hypothetical protein